MIINHFAAWATITFKQVQGHRVTVCQQQAYLVSLQVFYLDTINGKGPLQESEANALDGDEQWMLSTCCRFAGSHVKSRSLVMNHGSFVHGMIEHMSDDDVNPLVKEVTKLYVKAAAGISRIIVERDASNKSSDALPAVLPQELVRLEHSEFCANVRGHRKRLLACWTATKIKYH